MKSTVKIETFINSLGTFFHYESLFMSSFRKNLIIPKAARFQKAELFRYIYVYDPLGRYFSR